MKTTVLLLAIVSIIGYFVCRGFIEVAVITYFSKKGYRNYKKQTNFQQRYWLIWMKRNAKVKYLKSERRNVNYQRIMSAYFYTHIILFISLIATLSVVTLVCLGYLEMVYAELIIPIYLVEILLSFATCYFIVKYEHRNYYQKRNKHK